MVQHDVGHDRERGADVRCLRVRRDVGRGGPCDAGGDIECPCLGHAISCSLSASARRVPRMRTPGDHAPRASLTVACSPLGGG